MLRWITCLFILGFLALQIQSNYVSQDELNTLIEAVKANQQADGSLEQLYFSTNTLVILNEEVPNKNELCSLVKNVLAKSFYIEPIFYGVNLIENLGCGETASDVISETITDVLNDVDSTVEEIYWAVSTAVTLANNDHYEIEDGDFEVAATTLSERVDLDGTLSNGDGEDGNLYITGLGLQTLYLIATNSEVEDEFVFELVGENIESLLDYELNEHPVGGYAFYDFEDSRTALKTTSSLITGAFNFYSVYEFEYEQGLFEELVEFTINTKNSITGFDTGFYFVSLVDFFANHSLGRSVVLTLDTTSLSLSEKSNNIKASVTDVFGNSVGPCQVFLSSVVSYENPESVLISDQTLYANDNDEYEYNLLAAKPTQGFYILEFGVHSPEGYNDLTSSLKVIKILTSITIPLIDLEIVDSNDNELSKTYTAVSGRKFTEDLRTDFYYTLKYRFNVKGSNGKPVNVQQAFVRFSHNNPSFDIEATFPAKHSHGKYSLDLVLSTQGEELLFTSGDYHMQLIIGDSTVENPFLWDLGTINIGFPSERTISQQETVYADKSEIFHEFRVPDKRASEELSNAFTGLVLAPWLILFFGLISTKANVSNIPGGIGIIYSFVFVFSLAGIFSLFGLFFLQFNIFETLAFLGGLSLIASISGYGLLKRRGANRRKKEE